MPAENQISVWRWISVYGITASAMYFLRPQVIFFVMNVAWRIGRASDSTSALRPFDLYNGHIFAFQFFVGLVAGFAYVLLFECRRRIQVASWIWIVPLSLFFVALLRWHPSVQRSVLSATPLNAYWSAFVHHFWSQACGIDFSYWKTSYSWTRSGCFDQVVFMAPLYFGLAFSLGAALAATKAASRRMRRVKAFAAIQEKRLLRNSSAPISG